ncbi:CAP domain-containing protein [Micromonospora sp. BQ11]|uniref:CAP domain-containing protein n=1 Tax=Micromonospora sp. BQ11 TaxID=3452212 RepID=UPI003F8B9B13
MYGWTDPINPDDVDPRPEAATDEPAWLTDRPAPRSSYLFGDEPDGRDDERHPDQPTEQWRPEPGQADPYRADQPYGADQPYPADQSYPAEQPAAAWQPVDRWQDEPTTWRDEPTTAWQPADGWRDEPAPDRHEAASTAPLAAVPPLDAAGPVHPYRPAAPDAEAINEGQHRPSRRFPRPMLIGGAAAAATLVVSLGVGAVALTGGDDRTTASSAVDDTVAAAPVLPGTDGPPADPLAPTSPAAAPTSAKPSPAATPSRRPTPAPSRTTAPSRRTERSSAPTTSRRPTTSTSTSTSTGVSSQARQVVDLVNAERAKAGCGALGIDDKLMTAAQRHSQDQADHQDMSHDGSDGSDAGQRLDRVGYAWRTYGENVAWNQKTPAAVMDAWMNSPGHRANILNCAFTEIGVGVASSNGPYWTQVFAAPR